MLIIQTIAVIDEIRSCQVDTATREISISKVECYGETFWAEKIDIMLTCLTRYHIAVFKTVKIDNFPLKIRYFYLIKLNMKYA